MNRTDMVQQVVSLKSARRYPLILLAVPAVGWTLLFALVPVALLLFYSFLTSGFFAVTFPLTLENYRAVLGNMLTWRLALNAGIVGMATALICLAIGFFVALWLRYSESRWRGAVAFLVILSMFASYLVRIYAWRTILGEHGLLNSLLMTNGIIAQPMTALLFNKLSITVAMVHISLPYVILVLLASLRPLEHHYLEAASDLGANRMQIVARVILPLMATPMCSAFLFVFIMASADFVTPQFLGGPGDSMIGVLVSNNFISVGNWGGGAAVSALLLLGYGLCYSVVALGMRLLQSSEIKWGS